MNLLSRRVRPLLVSAGLMMWLAGCNSPSASDTKSVPGTFRMFLTTQRDNITYRLHFGTFNISGPTSTTLDSETDPSATVLTASLAPGNYTIDLQPGWVLERLDGTTYNAVQATLISLNPANFTIASQMTTSVIYQFSTDGTIVTVGNGTLDVGIDVVPPLSQQCVAAINSQRQSVGLPPYIEWSAGEPCAAGEAQSDATAGIAHSTFGQCGEFAQNECVGWPAPQSSALTNCLGAMWAEGPGDPTTHLDYLNLSSTAYTSVACGFYVTNAGAVWIVMDFQ